MDKALTKTSLVRQLADAETAPMVSILCPLDRTDAGNEHDPRQLLALQREALAQLVAVLPAGRVRAFERRLRDAFDHVDLRRPHEAVAIFVSENLTYTVPLDQPVEASVVVAGHFAIRELLHADAELRSARVLVLSQSRSRCVEICGDVAVERRDHGFPLTIEAPTEADTPHRDFPLDEHEHAEAAKFVFRAVHRALTELQRRDPKPLVLVGAERDLAYWDEIAKGENHVVGSVHGNYDFDTLDDLTKLVTPVLDARKRDRQVQFCTEVRESMTTNAMSGIVDVGAAAAEGRGRVLGHRGRIPFRRDRCCDRRRRAAQRRSRRGPQRRYHRPRTDRVAVALLTQGVAENRCGAASLVPRTTSSGSCRSPT